MTFLLCDPAGASTNLTSRINEMTTYAHTHTKLHCIDKDRLAIAAR